MMMPVLQAARRGLASSGSRSGALTLGGGDLSAAAAGGLAGCDVRQGGAGSTRWVELTGPGDPVLLRGAVVVVPDGSGAGSSDLLEGGSSSGDAVIIMLEASARIASSTPSTRGQGGSGGKGGAGGGGGSGGGGAEGGISGVEISVRTSGPSVAERRGISWRLPRLSADDRATRSFQLRLLG